MPHRARIASGLSEVVALFQRWADDPYDEAVTQRAHAEQCAALAAATGADDALVAAALLHDVGHLLALEDGATGPERSRDLAHESVGAVYLSGVFGDEVTRPIALHVAAKRYRCAVDPAYAAALSPASRHSLDLQGGVADRDETARFAADPYSEDALALRGWDDAGKVDDLVVESFEDHLPLLQRLADTT